MVRHLNWLAVAVALGAFIALGALPASAQKPAPTDQGQQGEFNGEHVDTGAAALDNGPEVAETGEAASATALLKSSHSVSAGLLSRSKAPAGTAAGMRRAAATGKATPKVAALTTNQDLNVDGNFDLQEIAGLNLEQIH